MKQAATIKLTDAQSSDEAVVIVRYDANHIALCLSLRSDGDVEVVMKKTDAERLVEALRTALGPS